MRLAAKMLRGLLSVVLVVGLMPSLAFAAGDDLDASSTPSNSSSDATNPNGDNSSNDGQSAPSDNPGSQPGGNDQGDSLNDQRDQSGVSGGNSDLEPNNDGSNGEETNNNANATNTDGDDASSVNKAVEEDADKASNEEEGKEEEEDASKKNAEPIHLTYKAHVSNIGWQDEVSDGEQAGTVGYGLPLEAFQIKVGETSVSGGISYSAHVANVGWQGYVADGETAGTTGYGQAVEAMRITLTGDLAAQYDVYYRVHVSELGWLGWAKNNEPAGSAGKALAVQAFEVKIVPAGSPFDGYGAKAAFEEPLITYAAHVSEIGWMAPQHDGATAGTTGQNLAVEAISIKNASSLVGGAVVSQGYTEFLGWQPEASNGTAGTTGYAKPLQAIKLSLSGELASMYDIYYRTHVSNVGWLDWASNGAAAGSLGYGEHIEAVQVVTVAKGGEAPGSTANPLQENGDFHYQAHSENYGWMSPVGAGELAGTSGEGLRLEALNISLGSTPGSIEYRAHVANVGWQDWVSDGATAGTIGQCNAIEALQIKLSGEAADTHDVYYRLHIANVGWLDWAKNGDTAGSAGCGLQAEAVQIQLVEKGGEAPGATASPYRELNYTYRANGDGYGWQADKTRGATAGTTGQAKAIYQLDTAVNAIGFTGELQISAHSADIGWQDFAGNGTPAGVEGKQIEAIKVQLTGDLAQCFDVWYRVHSANFGWLGWACNGAPAGTANMSRAVESVEIIVLPKGSSAPGSTAMPFRDWDPADLARILDSFWSGEFSVFGTNKGLSAYAYMLLADAIRNYWNGGCDVGFVMIDLSTGAGVAYRADQPYTSCCTIKAPYIISLNKYWPWTLSESSDDMFWSLYNSTNETYYALINRYGYSTINSLLAEVNANISWYGAGYFGWYTPKDLAKMWLSCSEYLLCDNSYNAQWLRDVLDDNFWITSRDAIVADVVYSKSGWIDTIHNEGALVVKDGHPYVISIMSSSSPSQSWRMAALVQALDQAHSELVG